VSLTAHAQDAVRPDVGKPLQAAQELIRAQKYKDALAKVHDADAVPNKTANESYLIERMRIAAASGAGRCGDRRQELRGGGERVSGRPNSSPWIESITGAYYRAGQYTRAQQWGQRYFKEGGTSVAIRTPAHPEPVLAGDFAGASKELTTEIQQAEKERRSAGEDRLKLLVNATLKMNDTKRLRVGARAARHLLPEEGVLVDLLARLQRKPNFSDRLALDTYRLSLATGSMSQANDFMEMAQLAVQAGSLNEAKQVLDKGFAANILGQGPQAERQKRLRDLVLRGPRKTRRARPRRSTTPRRAKDGTALVNIGMNQVYAGDKKGLELMQQGIAKTTSSESTTSSCTWRSRRAPPARRGKAQVPRRPPTPLRLSDKRSR